MGNYCRVEHGSMAAFRRRFDDFIAFVAKKTQGALKNVNLLLGIFSQMSSLGNSWAGPRFRSRASVPSLPGLKAGLV